MTTVNLKHLTRTDGKDEPLIEILFLDDRTKRLHAAMATYNPGTGYKLTIACNVKECLRQISCHDYDIISLDHDLNGCDFEDPDGDAVGMEVVRYIEKTGWPAEKPKPTFWVHSSNIFAAHLMVTSLQSMGYDAVWKRFEYPEKSFL